MSDHDTVPYLDGHIEVYDTTHRRIERDGEEVAETPVYDRAHLRIHPRGDDGYLATEMTPSDAYALFEAVRRRCPDAEDAEPHIADRLSVPLTDEEAAELEQRLREELAKPTAHRVRVLPPPSGETARLGTITHVEIRNIAPHGPASRIVIHSDTEGTARAFEFRSYEISDDGMTELWTLGPEVELEERARPKSVFEDPA